MENRHARQDMSNIVLLALNAMQINQQYMLSEVSLNNLKTTSKVIYCPTDAML